MTKFKLLKEVAFGLHNLSLDDNIRIKLRRELLPAGIQLWAFAYRMQMPGAPITVSLYGKGVDGNLFKGNQEAAAWFTIEWLKQNGKWDE